MNTERFKFRVWNKQQKRYKERYVIGSDGLAYLLDDVDDSWYDLIPDEEVVVEQCTGLKDKNGKLVYEGDVVRYYRSTAMGLGGERIASVAWDDRCGAWYILTTLGDGYDMYDALNFGIEIIGNIHDNEVTE